MREYILRIFPTFLPDRDAAAASPVRSAPYGAPAELRRGADTCSTLLAEVRLMAARQAFGRELNQMLVRACDLLDDMDEILVGLNPSRDPEAFGRLAALHRRLEEIQSLVPREQRRPRTAR